MRFCSFIEGVDFIVNNPLWHIIFNSIVCLVSQISPFGLNTLTLKLRFLPYLLKPQPTPGF